MNYGETLANWYLRLNGFFLLPNFVLHHLPSEAEDDRFNADIDLLAIRTPYTYEEIGGKSCDQDCELLGELIHPQLLTGVIVEVKTSLRANPVQRLSRLERGVQRLGLLPHEWSPEVADALMPNGQSASVVKTETAIIGTLLICSSNLRNRNLRKYSHVITLEECESFIIERFGAYADQKRSGRLFFSNDLIQYLASRAGM